MATTPTPIPTPSDITVSQGYRIDHLGRPPHDRQIPWEKRNRATRWVWLVGSVAFAVLAPVTLLGWIFWLIGLPTFGIWVGCAAATLPLILALRFGLIWNPQQVGLVAQNAPRGTVVPYGPGIHPRLAWEVVTEADNIPLQIIEHVFNIKIPTKTAQVDLEILFSWRPALENLDHFTNVKDDENTINNGFQSFLESSLNSRLTSQTAAYVRGMTNRINVMLQDEFMGEQKSDGSSPTEFETGFGIEVTAIRMRKMKLPDDVQKTLDAGDEAESMQEMIAGWLGLSPEELKEALRDGRVTPEQFAQHMQQAMVISGNASFNVNRIDIPGLVNNITRR